MSFERRRWNERYQGRESSERYVGKVQYLRVDHGYIRSKTKINGIRDVTFNFSDVHVQCVNSLQIGDIVSFRVNMYSSGKFCAIDIRKDSCVDSQSESNRSGSPISISSASVPDFTTNSHYLQDYEFDNSSCNSSGNCDFELFKKPFIIPSCNKKAEEKDPFSQSVDCYFERVLSRKYDPSYTTCWLTV